MYYIKEGIILSDQKSEVEFTNIGDHSLENDDTKEIVKFLENTLTNKRKINVNGIIHNFEATKTKIDSKGKSVLKKAEADNYDFIGKTSSILILKQMIKQEEDQNLFQDFKKKVLERVSQLKGMEDRKLSTIQTELLKASKEVDKQKESINRLDKEIQELGSNEISRKVAQISKLEDDKSEVEKKIDDFEHHEPTEKEEELAKKSEKQRNKLEDNELEIKFIEEKIKLLVKKKKFGKERHLNPISMVLTLGLVYWTKYSEIDWHISKLQLKIANKKEKSLKLMKNITKIEREINRSEKNKKDELVKKSKELDKLKDKVEKYEVKINSLTKDIDKLQRDLKPKINKREKMNDELHKLKDERDEIEKSKEEVMKYSTQRIRDLIDEIEKSRKAELEEIKKLKETLESQKTSIKGDWIVEI